ncbi:MAG: polysaccharide biosynthesis/export family protein, partial [Paracoccaceae bacterium]
MALFRRHVTASVALLLCAGVLTGCTLPRTGPNKSEIFSGSVQKQGDAFIVEVNEHVTRTTAVVPALGFTSAFRNAQLQGSDTIRPGDTLGLSIWENTDNSLLGGQASNSTRLDGVQVDEAGFIFVPYAGRIKAAGNSPDSIRKIITDRLKDQTPDPQVQVQREAGDGSTVSIIGAVGGQG